MSNVDSKLTRMKSLSPLVVIPFKVLLMNSKSEEIMEIESPVRVKFVISESFTVTDDKKALINTSWEWISV